MEQLLAVDLISAYRPLSFGRDEPLRKSLSQGLFRHGMLCWVEQDHIITIEKAGVASNQNGEIAPVLEAQPSAAIADCLGVQCLRDI
jgi:hypothetical protein